MEITVLNRQRERRVDPGRVAALAQRLTEIVPAGSADSFGICLVSDRTMTDYNRRYRRKNRTTDVLAFPGGRRRDAEGSRHLGDIVISAPRAAVQARAARHAFSRELGILLVHAYLHLLGYDHEVDDGAMLRLQRRIVRRLLPRRGSRRS